MLSPTQLQNEDRITYFAETDARNRKIKFGIKAKDRTRHMYVIGKTGMGKSTLLENMAVQDIQNGEGMAFIDPHGNTAELLLDYVSQERMKDVIYFAPFDMQYPISFNVMEDVGADKRHLVSNGLMSAFKKIWVDAWSARMEYILNNILLALLEYPDSTILGVNRMLADKTYREKVVACVTDSAVKAFWVDEFAKYSDKFMTEAGAAIQNKIGQFISNPLVRNIVGQPKSTFDIRKIMDERKILIINLSKGRVGEGNANLLGSMLITKIYLSAMSRADTGAADLKKLPNFYLFVDEFQNFANESFADILSEARKYKLNLCVAHQYIEQMTDEVRAAVFGNVGTMCTFRVGAYDAEVLEKEFSPFFTMEDIVNLGFTQIYLKLMIDGVSSKPFSATTIGPIPKPPVSMRELVIEESRKRYGRPRDEVEEAIRLWHQPMGMENRGRGVEKMNGEKPAVSERAFVPRAPVGDAPRPASAPRAFESRPAVPMAPRAAVTPQKDLGSVLSAIVPKKTEATAPTPIASAPKPVVQNLPVQTAPAVAQPQKESEPKPAVDHRPFAKAFATIKLPTKEEAEQKERDLRKAISLDYLKPQAKKEEPKERDMGPDLKAALAKLMQNAPVLKDDTSAPKKEEVKNPIIAVAEKPAPVAQKEAEAKTFSYTENVRPQEKVRTESADPRLVKIFTE